MAKPQPVEQPQEGHRQADIDARTMEQAEMDELQAMQNRMHSLLHAFYHDSEVHTVNFRINTDSEHNNQEAATRHAAHGGTYEHED